jgi:hypothetical protein
MRMGNSTPMCISFRNDIVEIQLVNVDTLEIDLKTLYESTTIRIDETSIGVVFTLYGYTFCIECFNDGTLLHFIHDSDGQTHTIVNDSIIPTLSSGLMALYYFDKYHTLTFTM